MQSSAIVSIDDLQKLSSNPNLIILDCTIDKVNQKIEHNTKSIPKAQFFDIERTFSDLSTGLPHSVINAESFTFYAQRLGINHDSIIVLYDRWGVYSSPRAWWMFRYMGHKQVYVLNGGLPAWEKANLPLGDQYTNHEAKGNFVASIQTEWFADKSLVLSEINNELSKTIDARGTGRFEGTVPEPRPGVRAGHIPNSDNIPFETVLSGIHLKPTAELAAIFNPHTSHNEHLIFTCGSGITACILALAAYETGLHHIKVYDGSWAEWGADNTLPIA